jgi:hypothetical protein
MKLTIDQQMRLDNVTKADLEWRTAKVEMAAIARRYAEEQIAHISYERDRAIRLAIEAGVPKRKLTQRDQGLHTTDPGAVTTSLARTQGVAVVIAAEETDPLARTYSITEDGNLRVTLNAEQMTEAKHLAHFDDKQAAAPEYADFTTILNRGVTQLEAVSPTVLDNYERNPITTWAFKHEAEALAWYAEHNGMEAAA